MAEAAGARRRRFYMTILIGGLSLGSAAAVSDEEHSIRSRLRTVLAGPVDQSEAINDIVAHLTSPFNEKANSLLLFGADARRAARALAQHNCLSADYTNVTKSWAASSEGAKELIETSRSGALGAVRGEKLYVVMEHMERLQCEDLHVINYLLPMMDNPALKHSTVFLYLYEEDEANVPAKGHREILVKKFTQCPPDPRVTVSAFFNRLQTVVFQPIPNGTTRRPDEPICPAGSQSWGMGPMSNSRIAVALAVSVAVIGSTFMALQWWGNKTGKTEEEEEGGLLTRTMAVEGGAGGGVMRTPERPSGRALAASASRTHTTESASRTHTHGSKGTTTPVRKSERLEQKRRKRSGDS